MTTTEDGPFSVEGDPPATIVHLAAQGADNLNARQTEITDSMTDLLAGIEYLVADQYLCDLMQASMEGNVKKIFHVIANQVTIDRLQASTAAERRRLLTDDRLDLEITLQACEFLGSAVLHTAK